MRYITPEWYYAMQKGIEGEFCDVDERAAQKDEAFFQELYDHMVQEEIDTSVSVSEVDAEGLWRRLMQPIVDAGEMDQATMDERMARVRESIDKNPRLVLTDEEARRKVDERIRIGVIYMKDRLPQDIIDQIADERVYALEVVSPRVAELLKEYREMNNQYVKECSRKSRKRFKELKGKIDPKLMRLFGFHDVLVTGVSRDGNELTLSLGESCNFNEVENIVFHDCEIEILDDLEDEQWLYEELDINEDGSLTVGVILTDRQGDRDCRLSVKQLVLTARDITLNQREGVLERQKAARERTKRLVAKGLVMQIPPNKKG